MMTLQDAEMGLCILRDAAAGINYLHHAQPPIIHTMLEPRKIMLDANYRGQVVAMPVPEVGLHYMCAGSNLMPLCIPSIPRRRAGQQSVALARFSSCFRSWHLSLTWAWASQVLALR